MASRHLWSALGSLGWRKSVSRTDSTELLVTTPVNNDHNGGRTQVKADVPDAQDNKRESARFTVFAISRSFQKLRSRFTGWKRGALSFATCASVVSLINFALTVWGLTSPKSSQSTLSIGDYDHIRRLNTGVHLIINIFSTILLGGSNYCMQCLSAPTRRNVDDAHENGDWLDIGILSFRNMTRLGLKKALMWCLLGMSSLPLHLL